VIFERRVFKRFLHLQNLTFREVPHFLKGDLPQIPSAMLKIPKYKREAPLISLIFLLCVPQYLRQRENSNQNVDVEPFQPPHSASSILMW
jgi:hypothetical protein